MERSLRQKLWRTTRDLQIQSPRSKVTWNSRGHGSAAGSGVEARSDSTGQTLGKDTPEKEIEGLEKNRGRAIRGRQEMKQRSRQSRI